MAHVPVDVDGTRIYVEVADQRGPGPVTSAPPPQSFDEVVDAVKAIAGQLNRAWAEVKPSEATVDFGLTLSVKSGKLASVLAEAGGEATLSISLTWKNDSAS